MPSQANSQALEALQLAASSWRKREGLASPLEVYRSRVIAWVSSRPDLEEPVPFDQLALESPLPAGLRVLLSGDPEPWFVKFRRDNPVMAAWLPLQPLEGIHITRVNPVALLWHEDKASRAALCGAASLLRHAAAGDGTALTWILRQTGWPAAAALVEAQSDEDGFYECGAGRVPRRCPSPRRLLLAAFGDRPRELEWIRELCDGADDWDSGPEALPVPRGEALLPGQSPSAPAWLSKL